MSTCEFCHGEFEPTRPGQRFCTDPEKHCRQNWHAQNKGPNGLVHGVYQRPSGGWSVVIHYEPAKLPKIKRGDRVKIDSVVRPDA